MIIPVLVFLSVISRFNRACAQNAIGQSVAKALMYLKTRQQDDGGFAEPGSQSSEKLTAWAVCAISAAGFDPKNFLTNEISPIDYLSKRAKSASRLTDFSVLCLAVSAAGENPKSFGGVNLVSKIKSNLNPDGHIGSMINDHTWALIALAAAGEPVPKTAVEWLAARQNIDGGFGYSEQSGSDPDDTGAVIQALVASGMEKSDQVIKRAVMYLRFCQAEDGGFSWQGEASNVASTAWAVQGLAASGEDPGSESWRSSEGTPIEYLLSMQEEDGHYRHSQNLDSYPCWMTVQVIPALLKRPFPIVRPEHQNDIPAPSYSAGANAQDEEEEIYGSSADEEGFTEDEQEDVTVEEESSISGDSSRSRDRSPQDSSNGKLATAGSEFQEAVAAREKKGSFELFLALCLGYGGLMLFAYLVISALYAQW